ncbi:MAG: hypothetical protein ACYCSO_10055 [Cuniculiplasma sp.]
MNRFAGGVILGNKLPETLDRVSVSWSWYDKINGTVEWIFKNNTTGIESFLLFRNGYYFGNAFWPVYINNSEFNEKFAISPLPLIDQGARNNNAPLCVAEFPDKKKIVCFLFTLSPGQQWSMLEGGFSESLPPSAYSVSLAIISGARDYCIKYDETQVSDWDSQTGTTYKGYEPNPSTFNTVKATVKTSYVSLFKDIVSDGSCP